MVKYLQGLSPQVVSRKVAVVPYQEIMLLPIGHIVHLIIVLRYLSASTKITYLFIHFLLMIAKFHHILVTL